MPEIRPLCPGFFSEELQSGYTMAYGFIQTLYIVAFAFLFEKKGFRLQWFVPLALGFVVIALLTAPEIGKGLLPDSMLAGASDPPPLIVALMYLIFLPIHAFITVKLLKFQSQSLSWLERLIVKGAIYMFAAMIAGFVFMVIMMAGMLLYKGFPQ
jgi:hypothetical protein